MRLTKKRAIKLTIELWEFLAESGLHKEDWDKWEQYGGIDKVQSGCFLCEYDDRKWTGILCEHCPYYQMFGDCDGINTAFSKWAATEDNETRKKFALKVLEELRQL